MKLTSKVGIAFAILCGLMAMGTAISFFSLGRHRHLHKLAQTLYTLTKISTGYLGQPL